MKKKIIIGKGKGSEASHASRRPSEEPPKRDPKSILLLLLPIVLALGVWVISREPPSQMEAPAQDAVSLNTDSASSDSTITNRDILAHDIEVAQFLRDLELPPSHVETLQTEAADHGILALERGKEIRFYAYAHSPLPYKVDYRQSATRVIEFIFSPFPEVRAIQKSSHIVTSHAAGIIKTTFWDAILDNQINHRLIGRMEEILQWSIDFYHLDPGDRFKVLYEEEIVEGQSVGIRGIDAIYFQSETRDHYAFLHADASGAQYYDYDGLSMRKRFLKAPVKYGKISSGYDPERIHPVLNQVLPHFGTDFAAPLNAKVYAVADGRITIIDRVGNTNNGKFIKIRHDKTYESQYLHLNDIAAGLREGTKVTQDQVIGYVGETGLATGPHVCFRFWKNRSQVDYQKEEIVYQPGSVAYRERERFLSTRDSLMQILMKITYQ